MRRYRAKFGAKMLAFVVLFVLGGGWIVKILWNALLPVIFGLPALTLWQAIGLLVLSRILLGGPRRGHWRGGHGHWRHKMAEKWARMTPEEKAEWKEKMRSRCGGKGWRAWHEQEEKGTEDLV